MNQEIEAVISIRKNLPFCRRELWGLLARFLLRLVGHLREASLSHGLAQEVRERPPGEEGWGLGTESKPEREEKGVERVWRVY